MPQGQSSGGFVLHKHVATSIAVKVCQVDTHTRPWDRQRDGDAMAPFWRCVDVRKKVGRVSVPIHVDPDIIIAPAACHVAIENPIA